MAITGKATHTTSADGTFSAAGTTAWNADQPVTFAGLTANRIIFALSSTDFTDSPDLTFGAATGQGLVVGAGTATTNVPGLSVTQTWNNGAIDFDAALLVNVTSTASGVNSSVVDFQVGGSSRSWLDKLGNWYGATSLRVTGSIGGTYVIMKRVGGAGQDFNGSAANDAWIGSNSAGSTGSVGIGSEQSGIAGIIVQASSGMVKFMDVTSSFPALKRSGTVIQARLADDSAAGTFEGKHNSSDGTAGITFGAQAVTSITVKDGLIVAKSP